MARIEMSGVSLTFKIREKNKLTLKEFLVGQMFRQSRNPIMEVRALQDLDLTIDQGDRLGIIGHNGAGKSTLLRTLAGIYPPTRGTLTVEGKVSSLFEISLGFEGEATGWDNIAYRSFLQGASPKQVTSTRQAIADFTELGDFLKMPIRFYSAGMMVRLAFSIATAIDPEILLIDEVLSVGDLAFQNKARTRMKEMMDKAQLIVMVSHDLKAIESICNRAIWMDHGRIRFAGSAQEAVAAYTASVQTTSQAA